MLEHVNVLTGLIYDSMAPSEKEDSEQVPPQLPEYSNAVRRRSPEALIFPISLFRLRYPDHDDSLTDRKISRRNDERDSE